MQVNKKFFHYCPYCGKALFRRRIAGRNRGICKNCDYIDFRNASPVSLAFIFSDKNEVLLAKRDREPYKGVWTIPGGYLEADEQPMDGIKRELKEETGCNVEPYKLFGFYLCHFDDLTQGWRYTLNIIYLSKITKGKMQPADDVSDLQYFSLNKLPKIAFKHEARALKDLKNHLNLHKS